MTNASGLSAGSYLVCWVLTSAVLLGLSAALHCGRLLRARRAVRS